MQNGFATKRTIYLLFINYFLLFILPGCSIQKQIARAAQSDVLSNKALQTAHVGLSIFDPAENKYLYNYQGDKYFVPASNTKIPTCYAAMKYLGDSLVGLRYNDRADLFIQPSGDPTFLHPDFSNQPVMRFLQTQTKTIWYADVPARTGWGSGWSWNDFDQYYMAESSTFPMYGNIVRFKKTNSFQSGIDSIPAFSIDITPRYFDRYVQVGNASWKNAKGFSVDRKFDENSFFISPDGSSTSKDIPFTNARTVVLLLLSDTIKKPVLHFSMSGKKLPNPIYSQPTDSMLKPMMHRSDNFFAEQSLLMAGYEAFGIMDAGQIADTIIKTNFKDLPQKPRWADGSGLSRYNLFTPQDFVAILNKMKNEFGMERIKVIFPTGGEGTISSYYKADSGYIYGKTGTLSGVVAFSGYMYTRKGKLLIFSTLVNNHQASATDVRRAIEKFLQGIRNNY